MMLKSNRIFATNRSKFMNAIAILRVSFMALSMAAATTALDQDHMERYSSSKLVFVSQVSGKDRLSCIHRAYHSSVACNSIHYAYSESLRRITNNITDMLTIQLLDRIYFINHTLNINIKNQKLKLLQINGKENTGTVLSARFSEGRANVKVACHANELPCPFYKLGLFNLVFEHFGPWLPAAVVLWNIIGVNISHCIFRSNNCSGINVLDSGATVTSSDFVENNNNVNFILPKNHLGSIFTFPDSNISSGGALSFVFRSGINIGAVVKDCRFSRNMAVRRENDSSFVPHSPNNTMYYRIGAGMLIVFVGISNGNTVSLQSNNFTLNKAFSGVSLSVITQDIAYNNSVRVTESLFHNNVADETSAGILFVSWDYSIFNKFIMDRCKVLNNSAPISAGFKGVFHSADPLRPTFPASQYVWITRSTFCGNNAMTASGIHLIYALPNSLKLLGAYSIKNITVCHHLTSGSERAHFKKTGESVSAYGGAILTNRVDISFEGDNFIYGNKGGSALYASNSEIRIKDGASLTFIGNEAQSSGGALSLSDVSHLVLHPGSTLTFKQNYARIYGGAIAVQTLGIPELIYQFNPTCFLQYSDNSVPPSKWKVRNV